MRVPIIEGRAIGPEDTLTSPRVGVVSESMARRVWPGQSAVGKQMRTQRGRIIQIVGVSRDYKVRTVGEAPRPMIHFARRQAPNLSSGILVRTAGPSSSILPSLRREVSAMDPELVPFQLTTMERETAHSLLPVRAGATILAGLGGFTVFLAAVGLYGLIAYSVSRRTREIGTRIALGATPSEIVRQVLGEGSRLLLFGTIVGFAISIAVGRLLESSLYGISTFDVLSFGAAIVVVSLVVLAANTIPAFAASRVDPIRALKVD